MNSKFIILVLTALIFQSAYAQHGRRHRNRNRQIANEAVADGLLPNSNRFQLNGNEGNIYKNDQRFINELLLLKTTTTTTTTTTTAAPIITPTTPVTTPPVTTSPVTTPPVTTPTATTPPVTTPPVTVTPTPVAKAHKVESSLYDDNSDSAANGDSDEYDDDDDDGAYFDDGLDDFDEKDLLKPCDQDSNKIGGLEKDDDISLGRSSTPRASYLQAVRRRLRLNYRRRVRIQRLRSQINRSRNLIRRQRMQIMRRRRMQYRRRRMYIIRRNRIMRRNRILRRNFLFRRRQQFERRRRQYRIRLEENLYKQRQKREREAFRRRRYRRRFYHQLATAPREFGVQQKKQTGRNLDYGDRLIESNEAFDDIPFQPEDTTVEIV